MAWIEGRPESNTLGESLVNKDSVLNCRSVGKKICVVHVIIFRKRMKILQRLSGLVIGKQGEHL